MTLEEAITEAIECLEMWCDSKAEAWSEGYTPISKIGTRMVINRIKRACVENGGAVPMHQVEEWRRNYRVTLQALHDENNELRALASSQAAKLLAKEAPRSLLEKFFNLPKD
jgi:hypothetical protein